jgi:hypothetical protein
MTTAKEDFAARNPGARIFARQEADGGIMLAVSPRRLVFCMAGAFHSEHIIGILQDAGAAGILTSDDFCALVDMTAFTGVINWEVIPQITEVMPKGNSLNKNAYIVRNDMFAKLAKINGALFPNTQHATFMTEKEARTWLGWD